MSPNVATPSSSRRVSCDFARTDNTEFANRRVVGEVFDETLKPGDVDTSRRETSRRGCRAPPVLRDRARRGRGESSTRASRLGQKAHVPRLRMQLLVAVIEPRAERTLGDSYWLDEQRHRGSDSVRCRDGDARPAGSRTRSRRPPSSSGSFGCPVDEGVFQIGASRSYQTTSLDADDAAPSAVCRCKTRGFQASAGSGRAAAGPLHACESRGARSVCASSRRSASSAATNATGPRRSAIAGSVVRWCLMSTAR